MATAYAQLNLRVPPEIIDSLKARAAADDITLGAAALEAFEAYLQSNGSAEASPETTGRAATKGA